MLIKVERQCTDQVKEPIEPIEWYQLNLEPVKPSTTKEESTIRSSANWTDKGSALPWKRQTKEDKKGTIKSSVKQSQAPIKSKRKTKVKPYP